MLAGKRAVRVGDQLLREIADLLLRRVKDPRIKGITLTGIQVSNDLKHARVYYSIMGGEGGIGEIQAGLDSAKGFIKREVGFRMDLKYVPEIVFKYDPTLEKSDKMERLFQTLKSGETEEVDE